MDRLIKLFLFPLTFIVSLIDHEIDALGVGLPCFINYIFDIKCLGCGISHAIISIWHGDFLVSIEHNKFGILVFLLLAYISFKELSSFITYPLKIKGKYNG
jgi:hypothetical protein